MKGLFCCLNLTTMKDKSLIPAALSHDAQWAIYEPSARQLLEQLRSTNAAAHRAEYEARQAEVEANRPQGDMGQLYDLGVEVIDGVAVISMVGPMLKAPTSFEPGTSTVRVRRALRAAASNPEIKAIVLRVDSPGGTVAGTFDLAEEVASASKKKPCYGYIEDLGCSAAYWAVSQCTEVYAGPTAIVGSIGTYMVLYDASGMAEQQGIKVHVISTGPHKGAGVFGAEVNDEQLAEFQRTVDDLNTHFLKAVNRARGLQLVAGEGAANGGVWVGSEAKKKGLVDGICLFDSVVERARAPKGAARADHNTETVSGYDLSPAGKKLTDESEQALAAVRGLTARFVDIRSKRQAEGRDLGSKARAHITEIASALDEARIAALAVVEHEAEANDPQPATPDVDLDEVIATFQQSVLG